MNHGSSRSFTKEMQETPMITGKTRGLILGGGGVTGLAWEIGVLHGLISKGIDLRGVDKIIGTSAGAFAATALMDERGISWAYDRQFSALVQEVPAVFSADLIETLSAILRECAGDDREAGRRMGAFALHASTIDVATRLAVVRDRLDRTDWPSDRLRFTAVDADTGSLHLLDETSGIDIVHAVGASGAAPGIWPVIEAGGRRWIDGGSVSPTNANLAVRFGQCLVISPMPISLSGIAVREELDMISAATDSFLIAPDERSLDAIGNNPFDPDRRRLAAEAGRAQGEHTAETLGVEWRRPTDGES
ncbi:patatin-like phospholipase family protein [Paraburkholderia sp. RL17-347-BIC-D]|uniref:patatin-like phospholipase family protein n=1 Tax=Paraburkholderia sp. RL17-347-BIC-D TaxID=3031632 RepID=UPI0038BADE10